MNTVTPQELESKIENNDNFQLIDLREDYEFEDFNIGGINIPLDNVLNSLDQINKDKDVVFICNSGKRSAAIIHALKRKENMDNLFSLKGGVTAYLEGI